MFERIIKTFNQQIAEFSRKGSPFGLWTKENRFVEVGLMGSVKKEKLALTRKIPTLVFEIVLRV